MATKDQTPAWMSDYGVPAGPATRTPNIRERSMEASIGSSQASAASSAATAGRTAALTPADVRLREAQADTAELRAEQARVALDKVRALAYPDAKGLQEAQDALLLEVKNLAAAKRLSQTTPGASGLLYSTMSNFSGSGAVTMDTLLTPVRSNVAFNTLQKMRSESPTGGALGNVSDKDISLLYSTEGSLDPRASDTAFQSAMDGLILKRVKTAGSIGVDAGALAEALGRDNVEQFAPHYQAYRFRPSDEKVLAEYVKRSKAAGNFDPTDYAAYMAQAYQASTGRAPDEGFVANALNVGRQIGASKGSAVGPIDYSNADETARKYLVTKAKGTAPEDISLGDVLSGGLVNFVPSTLDFAVDTVKALTVDLPDTLEGVVNIVGGATGLSDNPEAWNAVKQYYTDRYGSMEGIKRALRDDPASIVADVAGIASGGSLLAAKGTATAGKLARISELANAARKMEGFAAAASKWDPLVLATKGVKLTGAAGTRAAEAIGVGVPAKAAGVTGAEVKQAFQAGREGSPEFQQQMTETGEVTDPINKANAALGELYARRSKDYTRRMEQLKKSPEELKFDDVDAAVKAVRDVGQHKGIDISSAADVWDKVYDKVSEFRGMTSVEDFDAMKRAVGNIRDQYQRGTPQYKVANDVVKAINKTIVQKAPVYTDVMKDYRIASDVLGDLQSSIAAGAPSLDTTLAKLRRASSGKGPRGATVLNILESTPSGKGLGNMLAGQAFRGREAQGLSPSVSTAAALATGSPEALAGAMLSPRLLGEFTYGAGRRYGATERFVRGFPGADRAATGVDFLRTRAIPTGAPVLRVVNPYLIQPQISDFSFTLPSDEEQRQALLERYSPQVPAVPILSRAVPSLSDLSARYKLPGLYQGAPDLQALAERYAQPPEEGPPPEEPNTGFAIGGRVVAPAVY